MKKVSDVYCTAKDSSDFNTREGDCPVRSEHARRAISLFPSLDDCRNVLFPGKDLDDSGSISVENGILGQG